MTLNDFIQYLKQQSCTIQPLSNRGLSGSGFYIEVWINGIKRTHHFQTWQSGNHEISEEQIRFVCTQLWLDPPPHLRQIPTKKQIRQTIHKSRKRKK